jgi:segregation and condensation protein A
VAHPTWTIHTDVFDGPLDLLLYLVRRENIDLRALRLTQVTDAYLAYLDQMRDLNLSIAADYLVMAATLVHLKSLELLPRAPTVVDEDEVDPREALAERLRAYAAVSAAADALHLQPVEGREVFVREPSPTEDLDQPIAQVSVFALLERYREVMIRAEPPQIELDFSGPDFGTICASVLSALGAPGARTALADLLLALRSRSERVVAFVALLEMARFGWVGLLQRGHLGTVLVERTTVEADLPALTGWVEAS